MPFRLITACISAVFLLFAAGKATANDTSEAALWQAIADGRAVAMMRHALAPGTGDPANFALGDCATQRTLSNEGRAQARRIGDAFRANAIAQAQVMTSQWCRCRETADLLDLGTVTDLAALNSFFADRQAGPAQTAELLAFLRRQTGTAPLVLVTHQVNVTALTGIYPRSGEIVVFELAADGKPQVLGTIAPGG